MLLLILTGLGVSVPAPDPEPEPTPTPSVSAGNPSKRGVYTGKWLPRDIKPKVIQSPKKLSRREKKRLKQYETARISKPNEVKPKLKLPKLPSLDRTFESQALAQEVSRIEAEKKSQAQRASIDGSIGLMMLEAKQRAISDLLAQARNKQEQEEIALLLLIEDM